MFAIPQSVNFNKKDLNDKPLSILILIRAYFFLRILILAECGLARNRTWIWSFGNSYTIHCTTRPVQLIR